jgi:hypothetical protein
MKAKKHDSQEQSFDKIAADIESILANGHPLRNNFHFDEIVLQGEKAMRAFYAIKMRLNGDYTLVHVREDTTYKEGVRHLGGVPIHQMSDKYILVLDTKEFEEFPEGVRDALQQHPNLKVLAVDQGEVYPHEPSIPYRINTDNYLRDDNTHQDAKLTEVIDGC